jgi:hypothetical protein
VTSKRDVAAAVKQTTKPIAGLMQMSAVMRVSGYFSVNGKMLSLLGQLDVTDDIW